MLFDKAVVQVPESDPEESRIRGSIIRLVTHPFPKMRRCSIVKTQHTEETETG